MERKTKLAARYVFAILIILLGTLTDYFQPNKEFLGFPSVGQWLIYIAFIMLVIITLQSFKNKKRIVDERMHFIGYKATRITFLLLILASFSIIIIDGLKTITIPYHMFASYIIMFLTLTYLIAYKILERYN